MKKRMIKKLSLSKETITNLSTGELSQVKGGSLTILPQHGCTISCPEFGCATNKMCTVGCLPY
jgi:hypothetical protein